MAALAWDQVGERKYNAGVDRGVLYLTDGDPVVWNGLTSVEEAFDGEIKEFYMDGVKYHVHLTPNDFSGRLKAYTYPDEFESLIGISRYSSGVFAHDQPPHRFGLSYRTRLGDDVSGIDLGYEIHVLYNLVALPDTNVYSTLSDTTSPVEFSWGLSARPEAIPGFRPTAHISFKSNEMESFLLEYLEGILYGTSADDPYLPSPAELLAMASAKITIVDNGDGTWTATGSDALITMLDATTFQIEEANATYLDTDTYEISTTEA